MEGPQDPEKRAVLPLSSLACSHAVQVGTPQGSPRTMLTAARLTVARMQRQPVASSRGVGEENTAHVMREITVLSSAGARVDLETIVAYEASQMQTNCAFSLLCGI